MAKLVFVFRITAIYLLLLLGSGTAVAQQGRFLNNRLEKLAEALKNNYGLNCQRMETVRLGMYQVVVENDAFGEVYHIGFRLFSRDVIAQSPSPIYHFAERYLLELYLMNSQERMADQLKEDKVELRFFMQKDILSDKLKQALSSIQREIPFIITTDNSFYTILWRDNGKPCFSMRFPIQYELLWGMNKLECENLLQQRLDAFKVPKREELQMPDEAFLEEQENGCLRYAGDWYEIEQVNTNAYYKRTDKGIAPVYSVAYPVESVHNLFILMQGAKLQANVTQKRYGGKKTEFSLPLSQLLAFCHAEGCEPYVGIERIDQKQVSGCLILINRAMGYNHVGYFELPLSALSAESRATLTLELFAYVPTHNVQTIYEERSPFKRVNNTKKIIQDE